MPLPETPGHLEASLGQSIVGSLLLPPVTSLAPHERLPEILVVPRSARKGKVEIEVITKAIEESDELGNQLPKEIPWMSHTN